MCPVCLTRASQSPGADLASLPIGQVSMLRQTIRGATTTLVKAGWHVGDGRRTKCGKTDGPWALTERRPDVRRMCFACRERERWEAERERGGQGGVGSGRSWSVLLDAMVENPGVTALLAGAPGNLRSDDHPGA